MYRLSKSSMRLYSKTQGDKGKEVTKGGQTFLRTDYYGTRGQRIFCVIIEQGEKDDTCTIREYDVDDSGPEEVYSTEVGNTK